MTTVSIVLYKNSLEECYSVLEPLVNSVAERIFLIDHSGDDRLAVLAEYSPKISYFRQKNLGYGAGHNFAFQEVLKINPDGFHLVLNPDIILESEDILKMEQFMSRFPTVGCSMPRVLNPDGTNQRLCKYLPAPQDLFIKRFLPFLGRKKINRLCMGDSDYDKILSVPWLSGCFMFLRLDAIRQTGGFDERYFMYAEDIDFSRRIHQHFETVYCPDVTVEHQHQAGSYHSTKMLLIHIASIVRYFNKWGWFFDKERNIINERAKKKNLADSFLPNS